MSTEDRSGRTEYQERKRLLDASVNEPWKEGKIVTSWLTKRPPPKAKRPRCPNCLKPRTPWIRTETNLKEKTRTSMWGAQGMRRWNGYGHFCTLRCCEEFANEKVDRLLGLAEGDRREGWPPAKQKE